MSKIAILGAGISGLTAALDLHRKGYSVSIFEKNSISGGVIQSLQKDGFLAESGPHSMRIESRAIESFIYDLGLYSEILHPLPSCKNRFILRKGTLHPLPTSPFQFISSKLFSFRAKCRLLGEPFSAKPTCPEESLADFVKRRFGQEFLDYALDPFIAGIFAGNPNTLSLQHVFPKLYEIEQKYGSLLKGSLAQIKEKKTASATDKAQDNFKKYILSFKSGMQTLVKALESKLSKLIHFETPVHSIEFNPQASVCGSTSWTLKGADFEKTFSHIIIAIPTYRLSKITFSSEITQALQPVTTIPYAPVSNLTLGFQRSSIHHPLNGFGFLVPSKEKINILGCLFVSSAFENRAPEGHVTLSTFLGGSRQAGLAKISSTDAQGVILEDISKILQIKGEPTFCHYTQWPYAIPQYNIGYGKILKTLDNIENQFPGLFFTGNYRSGISVAQCIQSGLQASQKITDRMKGHSAIEESSVTFQENTIQSIR